MTRPRKRILLVCPDEMEASYLSCLLYVRGYCVLAESDAAGALDRAISTGIDLALVTFELEGIDGNELTRLLKDLLPDRPVVLTSNLMSGGAREHYADTFLGKDTSRARLIEVLKMMSQRKRGPKKQPKSVTVAEAEVCIA